MFCASQDRYFLTFITGKKCLGSKEKAKGEEEEGLVEVNRRLPSCHPALLFLRVLLLEL